MPDITEITFSPVEEKNRVPVVDLFNYYIANTFAAYPEQKVPYEFFNLFLEVSRHYPSVVATCPDGSLAGFGMLRPHNPMPAFRHTAEITYFLRPDMTGNGLGTRMLRHLEATGKAQGITTILASISSLNEGSIRFHARNGFCSCGRFVKIGIKNGVAFDTVWMQKDI